MAFDRADIYVRSADGEEFWQTEILSDVREIKWTGPGVEDANLVNHALVMILSADCDLTQDFNATAAGGATPDKLLHRVLLCDVMHSEQLRLSNTLNTKLWADVRKNKNERYQFLADVPSERDLQGAGFPTLAIDFKQYFCVSHEHLRLQLTTTAKRRCRLAPPFAQQVTQRFFGAQCRVGLPVDHDA